MPQRIKAPDGSTVTFPDGMSDDHIADVLRREYGGPTSQDQAGPMPSVAQMRAFAGVRSPTPGQDVGLSGMSGVASGMTGLADLVSAANPLSFAGNAIRSAASLASGELPSKPTLPGTLARSHAENGYKPQTTSGQWAHTAGAMAPNAVMGVGGLLQRAANVVLSTIGAEGSAQIVKAMGGGESAQNVGRTIGGIAGGAATGLRLNTNRPKAPPPPTLEELQKANKAEWAKVEASGYRFPKSDVKATAADIRALVKDAGVDLYPEAAKVASRVTTLASRGNLTPAQANRLRGQVGEKLLTPGSTEVSVGRDIKTRIDTLIDGANDPNLARARDLHTRVKKLEEVTNRVDSADLRASSTYAGGNKANAVRQNLRPLIDKKSPQRIRNLTPEETRAIRRTVGGTMGANAARLTGKMLDPRGLLGASVQTIFGLPTGGMSSLAMLPGVAASELSNALTLRSVDDLVRLIAMGGVKSQPGRIGYRPQFPALMAGLPGITGVAAAVPASAQDRSRKP